MRFHHVLKNGKWVKVDGPAPPRYKPVRHVIPDIQPYKAVAGDMAGREISSRSHHREFLKRNDFVEVGNEWEAATTKEPEVSQHDDIAREIVKQLR